MEQKSPFQANTISIIKRAVTPAGNAILYFFHPALNSIPIQVGQVLTMPIPKLWK
ncbi:hypothetical protein LNTAR_18925 [Lentisphaera araneosa HTCC2155]|uniref:Uncharacterized protein n=1 Tax=Lentisphaera araneosa HTCC2155 TaxID=313628 RepID=A6DNU1_9BACT|nr:hypothetical protein LNTAR_18925 [Lentisphaera araneosa HTCC2155]